MTVDPTAEAAGHAFYSRRSLRAYDALILGWFSRTAWRCPSGRHVQLHDRHVSNNHLDIGVGTGYFLDRCRFPTQDPRIVLMDPNTACLEAASVRLSRYRPERVEASAFEPFPASVGGVDSVSLTYLLHCLPGTMASKSVVFDHVASVLNSGGVVFGATLLQGGVRRNWYARSVMAFNNRRGIFCNAEDSLGSLAEALEARFDDVQIEVIGCVAAFAASARASAGR
ncbi:MAG: class I SAM-dependent methyltransferase [Acidimicrobiales bacterium]